jgi:very-short-patch-repair endonuclease
MKNLNQFHFIDGKTLNKRKLLLPKATEIEKNRARQLRKGGVLSEVLFWQLVKNNKFHNIDFDRQRCIGNYIVDFYLRDYGVIIELDGISHREKYVYDLTREKYLESLGLVVIHIQATLVFTSPNGVLKLLEIALIKHFS